MVIFFKLLLGYMWDCFRSHERLKAEILILRHQLNILHRKAPKRLRLSGGDRALFVWLYRRFPAEPQDDKHEQSLGGFEQWAFAIAPSRPDHHGRMDTSNVRSDRSAVNASTM